MELCLTCKQPEPHDLFSCIEYFQDRVDHLETVLKELGEGSCCQTPGCCEDDPMCDPMIARAGIREVS